MLEGGENGCDEVLKKLWLSYCETWSESWWRSWFKPLCKSAVTDGDAAVRVFATTSPEAGVVVLRNSKTGKCFDAQGGVCNACSGCSGALPV